MKLLTGGNKTPVFWEIWTYKQGYKWYVLADFGAATWTDTCRCVVWTNLLLYIVHEKYFLQYHLYSIAFNWVFSLRECNILWLKVATRNSYTGIEIRTDLKNTANVFETTTLTFWYFSTHNGVLHILKLCIPQSA